jgi:iron only hydrogenase large subunit-like protein
MTCIGGCIGGGGQPKSKDPQYLTKRMRVRPCASLYPRGGAVGGTHAYGCS